MPYIINHSQQSIIMVEPQIKTKCLAHSKHQGHHAGGQDWMLNLKVLHMFFMSFQVCSTATLSPKFQYSLSIYWIHHAKSLALTALSTCAGLFLCLVLWYLTSSGIRVHTAFRIFFFHSKKVNFLMKRNFRVHEFMSMLPTSSHNKQ